MTKTVSYLERKIPGIPIPSLLKNRLLKFLLLASAFLISLSGCSNGGPNVLFRSKELRAYYKEQWKSTHAPVIRLKQEDDTSRYRLAPGEGFSMRFVNYPEEVLLAIAVAYGRSRTPNIQQSGGQTFGSGIDANQGGMSFSLDAKGEAGLPLLGNVNLNGMTLDEVRHYLQNRYKEYVPDGDIFLTPTSLRVVVFGEGTQQIVFLPREAMHLTEVLALNSGIPYEARARKVQIIRGDLNDPQVIWVNLQDIGSLSSKDLIIRHKDIIYLPPRGGVVFSREFGLYSLLFGSLNLIISLTILFSNL